MIRIYGRWAGEPKGREEDVTRCIEEVFPSGYGGGGIIPYQCQRKRGHGPAGLFCKQHGRIAQSKLETRGADWFKAEYGDA
jgi:hypothetical protein